MIKLDNPLVDMTSLLARASLGVEGAEADLDAAWSKQQAVFQASRQALEAQMKALDLAEKGAAAAVTAARNSGAAVRAYADAMKPWGLDPRVALAGFLSLAPGRPGKT